MEYCLAVNRILLLLTLWLVSVAAAYQFGRTHSDGPESSPVPTEFGQAAAANSGSAPTTPDSGDFRRNFQLDAAGLASGDWTELARDAWSRGAGSELLNGAQQLAESGRGLDAIALVQAYHQVAGDQQALFTLSDLLMMDGQMLAALEPLFQILDYPESPQLAERARRRLELIITAQEQLLSNAADTAGLISFFERLVNREPGYDGHRLKLARWMLQAGDLTSAAATLQQTGSNGVTDVEREQLAAEIAAEAQVLPIDRVGDGYFATVRVVPGSYAGAHSLRLLVDTGATTTSFSAEVLDTMGARRLSERVRVNTANGVTEMATYRLESLQLGDMTVNDLTVLALPSTPGGVDGLLGMDVLDQLPKAVGTPRKAR